MHEGRGRLYKPDMNRVGVPSHMHYSMAMGLHCNCNVIILGLRNIITSEGYKIVWELTGSSQLIKLAYPQANSHGRSGTARPEMHVHIERYKHTI